MDSIVEEAKDDEELKSNKGENEPVRFDFENENMNKLDSEKYVKDDVDQENQKELDKKIDIAVEEGEADGKVKSNKGEKKSVTFDLENDEEDVKDNQIQVQVHTAITTLNLVMECLEKIGGKIDDDYIFFPSSQKDIGRYSVVTEDITDDEKNGKNKQDENEDIRKNDTESAEKLVADPVVKESDEKKPESIIEINQDDTKGEEEQSTNDSNEDKVDIEKLKETNDDKKKVKESTDKVENKDIEPETSPQITPEKQEPTNVER